MQPSSPARLKSDDVTQLLPAFRVAVSLLVARMRALRFDPVVFDAVRTAEEAAKNAAAGKGIVGSMHEYGCAADLVCQLHHWDCGKQTPRCSFYETLGREAKSMGMVWGGDWGRRDLVHVQAIPVPWQDKMRALGVGPESVAARNQLVIDHLFAAKVAT
jgi:hypothetical protein